MGVEVVPVFAPPPVIFEQILPSGAFDVALFAWNAGPDPGGKSIFGCEGFQNYTGYCQRLVTAAFDQAERTFDAVQQARVLNRADGQLARDVPVIPLFEQPPVRQRCDRLFGASSPNFLDPLVNAENWWHER